MRRLIGAALIAATLGSGMVYMGRTYWCDWTEPGGWLGWLAGCRYPAGGGSSGAE